MKINKILARNFFRVLAISLQVKSIHTLRQDLREGQYVPIINKLLNYKRIVKSAQSAHKFHIGYKILGRIAITDSMCMLHNPPLALQDFLLP